MPCVKSSLILLVALGSSLLSAIWETSRIACVPSGSCEESEKESVNMGQYGYSGEEDKLSSSERAGGGNAQHTGRYAHVTTSHRVGIRTPSPLNVPRIGSGCHCESKPQKTAEGPCE